MRSIFFLSVMNGSAWGGSEELWYQSALYCAKKGYRVGVSCFYWKEKKEQLKKLEEAGCELFLLNFKPNGLALVENWRLQRVLRNIPFAKYDKVVVNQGGWKEIVHGPFKHLYKQLGEYYLLFHNYNEDQGLQGAKLKLFRHWLSHSRKNIGAASRIFTAIEKTSGFVVPHKEVLFNPITFTPNRSVTNFTCTPDEKAIFIMLGALEIERKAHDLLIKTFSSEKWINRNWELNIYGDGKDRDLLLGLIKQLKLQDKIFLKGVTNDVKQALHNGHLLLQVTRIDAMPIAVVEAMSMSRPAVVSNVGDMPQWVNPGVNGWIVKELTIPAIDEELEAAWIMRSNWEVMGAKSFEIFTRKFPANVFEYFLLQLEESNVIP